MEPTARIYVHLTVDAVDAVVYDPENRYDAELYDRYPSFIEARDAALSSIELMLDEEDYDGDDHRDELERMHRILEPAQTFDDLLHDSEYRWFLERLAPARTAA